MEASEPEPSPDRFRMTLDDVDFEVAHDPDQPGAYHYTRLTDPASGYGFTSRRSDERRSTMPEHEERVRDFLAMVDPVTGYIEDDPDDDGQDDTLDS